MFPLRVNQPLYSKTVSTFSVIAVNVVVFLYQLSLNDHFAFFAHWGVTATSNFRLATIFSSMFIHGAWLNIIGNMMFLWCFGRSLEDVMGSVRFLIFYLLCGMVAGFAHCAAALAGFGGHGPLIGAGGAILGVAGAYLRNFPRARIKTLIWLVFFPLVIDLPGLVVLGIWFVLPFFFGSAGQTAYLAVIGGLLAGTLLVGVVGIQTPYQRRRDLYW
jgi:membrane associated rhomboid family serine protease